MIIDNKLFESLFEQAAVSERKRMNYDLQTSGEDTSQRMLNALLPETVVPVHRHKDTTETVIVMKGSVTEVLYELDEQDELKETGRFQLSPGEGIQILAGQWHTIIAHEPSVIFEAKDGAFHPAKPEDVRH